MFASQACAHLVNRYRSGWVSVEGVIGWAHLVLKPLFHSTVTRHQDTQSISDDFALSGVFTASDLGLHKACHLRGQGDAELLGCAHDGSQELSRIESYAFGCLSANRTGFEGGIPLKPIEIDTFI
jgi:hypothetical protein